MNNNSEMKVCQNLQVFNVGEGSFSFISTQAIMCKEEVHAAVLHVYRDGKIMPRYTCEITQQKRAIIDAFAFILSLMREYTCGEDNLGLSLSGRMYVQHVS